jgi:REP element-mobilizing transposase RayT
MTKIWIHAIWSTKNRMPHIDDALGLLLYTFLEEKLESAGCRAIMINGLEDHVHVLFRLNKNLSIGEILSRLKGSSARYINSLHAKDELFEWQRGYAAFSIDNQNLARVCGYIKNQKNRVRGGLGLKS